MYTPNYFFFRNSISEIKSDKKIFEKIITMKIYLLNAIKIFGRKQTAKNDQFWNFEPYFSLKFLRGRRVFGRTY